MEELVALFDSYGPYLWLGLLFLLLLMALWLLNLHRRLSAMVRHYDSLIADVGEGGLVEVLDRHLSQVAETTTRVDRLDGFCRELEGATRAAIQRVGLVRFNPFEDTGGNQSFALALLDTAGDGLVFSSLFSRAESRLYVKPIRRGRSDYPLSDEENEAIRRAIGQESNNGTEQQNP